MQEQVVYRWDTCSTGLDIFIRTSDNVKIRPTAPWRQLFDNLYSFARIEMSHVTNAQSATLIWQVRGLRVQRHRVCTIGNYLQSIGQGCETIKIMGLQRVRNHNQLAKAGGGD